MLGKPLRNRNAPRAADLEQKENCGLRYSAEIGASRAALLRAAVDGACSESLSEIRIPPALRGVFLFRRGRDSTYSDVSC